jgi:hypothetical protein
MRQHCALDAAAMVKGARVPEDRQRFLPGRQGLLAGRNAADSAPTLLQVIRALENGLSRILRIAVDTMIEVKRQRSRRRSFCLS